jgi:hypothetical protein
VVCHYVVISTWHESKEDKDFYFFPKILGPLTSVLNSTSNRILVIKRDVLRFFVNGDKMRQVDQSLFKAVQSKFKKKILNSFIQLYVN